MYLCFRFLKAVQSFMQIVKSLLIIVILLVGCKPHVATDTDGAAVEWLPLDSAQIYDENGYNYTVYADTFDLKNGYRLTLYPMQNGVNEAGYAEYGHYARLTGNGVDTVVSAANTEMEKYLLRYDSIDFDDYFVLEYSAGGNYALYTDIIEKKTGKHLLEEDAYAGCYDVENQLVLYYDAYNPSDEYDDETLMTLRDLKSNKIYKVKQPYAQSCFGAMGYWAYFEIQRVTADMVYISYNGCEKPIVIKVKR